MKMKEFGPRGGARPWRPLLDPPMGNVGVTRQGPTTDDHISFIFLTYTTVAEML